MRIRCIKPEFWKDDLAASWPVISRLTYIGLWSESDDWGRFRMIPEYLRSQIFPYDSKLKMEAALAPILDARRVFVYEIRGVAYGLLVNFRKHQRINRKSRPQCPPPPNDELIKFIEENMRTQCGLSESSVSPHGFFTTEELRTHPRNKGTREQGNREQGEEGTPPVGDFIFEELIRSEALRELTYEQDLLARKVWEKWRERLTPAVAKEIADRATVDMPEAPGPWLRRQYDKLARAQSAGVGSVQVALQGGFSKKETGAAEDERPMRSEGGVG